MLIPSYLRVNVIPKQPVGKWKNSFPCNWFDFFFGIDYIWSKTDCFLIEWANIPKEHLSKLYRHGMGMAEHCIEVYFHLITCVFIIQK